MNKNTLETLKKYFGYASFREGQERIVNTILSGRDALAIMPTGAGKSNAVYHLLDQITKDGKTTFLVVEPAKGEYKHVFGSDEARIKVEIVDEIPVLASGKRKYIENRCEKYQDHKGICG